MHHHRKSTLASLLFGSLFGAAACSLPSFGAEDNKAEWDCELNGIWKVTNYTVDGSVRETGDLRYVFKNGVVVSASLETREFMPRESKQRPFGDPARDSSQPFDGPPSQSRTSNASNTSDADFVNLGVYNASVRKKTPHRWIDLCSSWEEPEEKLLGLYEIKGNELRIVFGNERPPSLTPARNEFTPSSLGPRTLTMVRITKPECDNPILSDSSGP